MFEHIDHTDQITMRTLPLIVASTDRCEFFERRSDTIFNGNDCWHCKYGEFGIDTDTPTEEGYCKYKIVQENYADEEK